MNSNSKSFYFPNLDGLRAIAALTVVFLHFNQFLPILYKVPSIVKGNEMAELSVILFFVLSGFLITYLLFIEKESTGKISVRNFYLKRIFRIWPPYFLVLLVAILLFPLYKDVPGNPTNTVNFFKSIFIYVLILPNVNSVLGIALTPLRPLWSIGVEEQFYLIWPWGVKKFKNYLVAIIGFIVFYVIILLIFEGLTPYSHVAGFIKNIIRISPMHIMAIGALGAFVVKERLPILNIIHNKAVQIVTWGIYLYSFYSPIRIPYLQHEFYAIIFLVIIINAATNNKTLIPLEIKPLKYLGRISYGLYVYHFPVMVILSILVPSGFLNSYEWLFVVMATTILFAGLSYRFYEKPFLALKNKLGQRKMKPQMSL